MAETRAGQNDAARPAGSDEAASSAEAYPQPFSPRALFWLKTLVIGMAVLILLGFVGLIVGVARVASQRGVDAQPVAHHAGRAATAQGSVGEGAPLPVGSTSGNAGIPAGAANDFALPTGARIANLSLDGDRLAIHYSGPDGDGIAVVDARTGKVLMRLRIAPPQ